ncbi:MAG TPA: hypothetical protein VJP81_11120 [Candidatus Dormibacteraeota bacterium]|nr:hypothetical protein [Candidatus Dormibacteraeota bacterium]
MSREQVNQEWQQTVKGFGKLLEQITPWLLELGSWVFGALIAFNLLLLAALLTVGPVDRAVLVATAALALALPPDVAGLVLLRLVADVSKIRLEDVASRSFEEAGFKAEDVRPDEDIESAMKRRTRTVLIYCYTILAVSVLLTMVGITAGFWHMAWWIGLLFLATAVVSLGLVLGSFSAAPSRKRSSTK